MAKYANPSTKDQQPGTVTTDFNGAAIIDENGLEIPITEDMVRRICEVASPA